MPGTSTSVARGLDGVVAARTRLSHVDGDRGELIIGGYELKELAGRVSFEAAAHLLWRGTLPTRDELERLRREFAAVRALPEQTLEVVRTAAKVPPIDALRMGCATLSLDLADPDDISPTADLEAAKRRPARCSTCCWRSARPTGLRRGCGTSSRPVAASWASVTASTRSATRAPTSSRTWWTRWRRPGSRTGRCSIWRARWSRPP